MKLKKSIIAVFVILMTVVSCVGEKDDSVSSQDKEITLTDNAGRQVVLPYPVKTAVVANRYNSELIRACGAIDKVIASDMGTAQDREYWANFDPANVIGKGASSLNYEKIIELNPQVLILPANGAYEEAEKKLTPFGIKVFVISGYDTADFKNQVENIGKMFNTEDRSKKFYDYFNSKLEYIKNNISEDKKRTLYLETVKPLTSTVPGDYFYTMTEYAGAINIFAQDFKSINKAEINPEEVLKRNPDVIVKFLTADNAISGTGVYQPPRKEQFIESYNQIKGRAGWDTVNAVKNKDIYFMTQFSHGGASKLIGAIYIAKWMYPDLLPELNPDEVYRTWLEDFQGFRNIEGHFYDIKSLINE